jgi:plasmid stabilization system protein ParE
MAEHKQEIVWSPESRADLDEIWDFYEEAAGAHTAENLLRRIYEGCQVLTELPLVGRPRSEIRPGLHSILIAPFMVFYQIGRDGVAEIMHVLHDRQDIEAAFDA